MYTEDIRKLIASGDIKGAIHKLLLLTPQITDKDFRNFILATSARFNVNYRKTNLGIGDDKVEDNKIINAILDLLDELEKSNLTVDRNENEEFGIDELKTFEEYYNLKSIYNKFGDLKQGEKAQLYLKSIQLQQKLYEDISINLKSDYPHIIFNRLYYEKELYEVEYQQLSAAVSDTDLKWYEKSIIISALTLSILRELDEKKLSILVEFVLQFENNLWQKALVGVVLGIYNRDNLLLFYPEVIKRLSELKNHKKIFAGVVQITNALMNEEFGGHIEEWIGKLPKLNYDYFQLPQNWFVPFYRSNPILESVKKNMPNIENIEKLPELIITDKHLSNSEKYSLVLSSNHWTDERAMEIYETLSESSLCEKDHEFYDHLREIHIFIQEFRDENITIDIGSNILIENSKVYDYLIEDNLIPLVKSQIYHFKDNKEKVLYWLLKHVKLKPDDSGAHCQIGEALESMREFEKAIEYHWKAYELDNEHTHSFYSIARCNFALDKQQEVIEALDMFPEYDKLSEIELNWVAHSRLFFSHEFEKAKQAFAYLCNNFSNSEKLPKYMLYHVMTRMSTKDFDSIEDLRKEYKLPEEPISSLGAFYTILLISLESNDNRELTLERFNQVLSKEDIQFAQKLMPNLFNQQS